MDLRIDDIEHLFLGLKEIAEALGSSLAAGAPAVMRLSGASVTETTSGSAVTYELSSGWVYWPGSGEIFKVESKTITKQLSSPLVPVWVQVDQVPADEPRLLSDLVSLHTLKINRKADLILASPGGAGTAGYLGDYSATSRILDSLYQIRDQHREFVQYIPSLTAVGGTLQPGYSAVRYAITGKLAHLSAWIDLIVTSGSVTQIQIPLQGLTLAPGCRVKTAYPGGSAVADALDDSGKIILLPAPALSASHTVSFQITLETA
jgi:hypothetical protein